MRTASDDLRRVFLCTETPKTTLASDQPNGHKRRVLESKASNTSSHIKINISLFQLLKIMRFHLQKQDILCRQQAVVEVKTLLPNSFDGEPQSLNQKCKEIAVEVK